MNTLYRQAKSVYDRFHTDNVTDYKTFWYSHDMRFHFL